MVRPDSLPAQSERENDFWSAAMSDILVAYQTMAAWLESDGREMSDEVMEALTVVLEYAAVEHERLRARIADLEAALAGE
jgi:hypothetical protein